MSPVIAPIDETKAADVKTSCTIYHGDNVEKQSYSWVASGPIKSYLMSCADGNLMRVQAGALDGKILIEYYDKAYNFLSSRTLDLDLPIFGGFYEDDDAYYVLTGQKNPAESDTVVTYRISKYSKTWQAIGRADLYGANTLEPFAASTARFDKFGKYLLIHTGHTMYKSPDGANHQANASIMVDTSNMTIADAQYLVAYTAAGYTSHSFNQFVRVDGNHMITVDQGDAYPRALLLHKDLYDLNTGVFQGPYDGQPFINKEVLSFQGGTGENYTGVMVGGFEYSDSNYLIAGTQDVTYGDSSCNNIFLASVPKDFSSSTVHWYTNYASTGKMASNPHFVKLGSNRFILMWSSDGNIYYTEVDGAGSAVGNLYTFPGNLSDCVPQLIDGKLIWYTWDDEIKFFYEISASDLSKNETTIIVDGHKFEYGPAADKKVTGICSQCGEERIFAVPTGYSFSWTEHGESIAWYSGDYDMKPGKKVDYHIFYDYDPKAEYLLSEIKVSSSDENYYLRKEYRRCLD